MIAPRRPSSRPFLSAPRTDFYHPARVIDAALHGLERAIRRSEGIGLVVGPPGTGKSLLLAKVAEHVRDDFDVALLSGARICTRRALWQSILAEIGESYRGIDEGELRIAVVDRVRGLAATGSGIVILVDEAHTLPTRLLEELRLLTNIPTPLPAVHLVLAGTMAMEERLGLPRMESLSQRIGVRFYLEPLDHAETVAYLRTQMKVAGQRWEASFEPGADDAVFGATDGVPRLVNQLCDLALVRAAENGGKRVAPSDIASAWRDIQCLPAAGMSAPLAHGTDGRADREETDTSLGSIGGDVVEFGGLDANLDPPDAGDDGGPFDDGWGSDDGGLLHHDEDPAPGRAARETAVAPPDRPESNPWSGPEIEIVFDGDADPFEEYFSTVHPSASSPSGTVERCFVRGPDDFADRRHVASREGSSLARRLPEGDIHRPDAAPERVDRIDASSAESVVPEDADMLVIEEDEWIPPPQDGAWRATPVRPGDYRRLFARMRRGGSGD